MNDHPLVTVVTVTYNSAQYVRDAIESVLAQQHTGIEYIIGDDCSTDDTWNIIAGYTDSRIRAYRNSSNIGEYANRNKALQMAGGKYLLFIDGDDMVLPHGLSYMVTMLEAFPDAAMAIVGYDCNHFIYPLEFTPEQIYKFQFFGKGFLSFSMVGNLFRTARLKEAGGFPTNLAFGDYYIRLKLARNYNCLIIGGNPVWARATPGQASTRIRTGKGYAELLRTSREFILAEECPLSPEDRQQALCNIFRPVASTILKDLLRFRWAAARSLLKALGWKRTDVMRYFSAPTDHSYMQEYDSTRLLKMDLSRNPYAQTHAQAPPPQKTISRNEPAK